MINCCLRTPGWLRLLQHRAWHHTGDNRVLLTFDDGPHPVWTPYLLEILARFNLRGLFFLRGDHLQLHPETARLISTGGHWLGLHGMQHGSQLLRSRLAVRTELQVQQRQFEEVGLPRALFCRPPYGYYLPTYTGAAEDLKLTTMLWSLMIRDYRPLQPQLLQRRLLRLQQAGDIILLHDHAQGTPQLLEMLPGYLEASLARNVRFVLQGEEL
ncbi:MAG: polysaccharide deacetylase family protein [Candidatus Delongbacteria bacterium]|nr:polysaccharide deacetylase family protein [Candidatus Delongbacteria bacterium]